MVEATSTGVRALSSACVAYFAADTSSSAARKLGFLEAAIRTASSAESVSAEATLADKTPLASTTAHASHRVARFPRLRTRNSLMTHKLGNAMSRAVRVVSGFVKTSSVSLSLLA